jgi:Domain of unknown function (DUF4397)
MLFLCGDLIVKLLNKTFLMIMKTAKILSIALLMTPLFILSSCKPDPDPVVPAVYGKVLLFNGAAGAPAVDLYVDGTKSNATAIAYGGASAYAQIEAGTIAHKLFTKTVTGAVIDSVPSFKANKDVGYSYYAYKDNDATGSFRVIATTDALTAPAAGKAKIRIVQLIPDIANNTAIDIEVVATGGIATNRNDFTAVKFKESRDFIELAKGTYDLKVKYTGTTNLVITKATPITLAEGKIYTFVAHGLSSKINTDPLTAVVSTITNN